MRRTIQRLALAAALPAAAAPLHAQVDARLLRYPDVSASQITFVYGGDIWIVPKTGGTAQRLSSPRGEESFPRFSPDGSRIAFTGNYDGNTDLYVVPTAGGMPERVTHHPAADRLLDWAPDGLSLLFASSMQSEKDRFNKIFRVSSQGGLPEKLPMPYGETGSLSADGKTIAYTYGTRDFDTWKRYRGGNTQEIWLFDLERNSARKLTQDDANDSQPMWHGSMIYFLSDRGENQRSNLWAYDTQSGQLRQVTQFSAHDVRFPAMGPDEIVFENGGRLFLLPLSGGEPREVSVQVMSDLAGMRPRVEKVGGLVQSFGVSPTGMRAVFEARGEVFTVPAENGIVRNVSASSGTAERFPSWSPDGRSIAYWTDRSGEYELAIRPADGTGAERTVTNLGKGYRYLPQWSPDSERIAFIDQAMKIHLLDVASGRVRPAGQLGYGSDGSLQAFRVSWSPDSRWFAFAGDTQGRPASSVHLYDTRDSKLHIATSGFYDAFEPVFDPEGKYLYFLTNRSFQPTYSTLDNSFIYANATQIAAVPLRAGVASPLAPRNDEEPAKPDSSAAPADAGDAAKPAAVPAVEIDLEGFERRAVILPPEAGNYGELAAVPGKVLFHRHVRTGSGEEKNAVVYYDLKEREEKVVLDDAATFLLTADGKKMIARLKDSYAIVEVKPAQKMEKPLAVASLEMTVDPKAEWKQMFADAWRFERDFFYDPGMHGVDWEAMRGQYGSLVDDASTREDLHFILGELIGELNASHTYRGGGSLEQPIQRNVGMLGADFALDGGAYRIQRIVDGAPWDSEVRSPLRQAGVDVREGDYLLAVDGDPLDVSKDPWAAFQGRGGRTVALTVNSRPTLEGSRTVLVETLAGEGRLRNLAWIDANRRKVEEATGGRVGYIYVPDTGINGQTELVRQFYGQFHKDGLIIDERFNSGGQIPDRFVELLNRPITNFWGVRDGVDWQWPQTAHTGPKVMLVNEWSGSGGDAFPFYFKQAGLGPVIGKRTWGGLIGISGAPTLLDGGSVTVPTFGIYSTDGEWIIENHGVEPDIEVEADPSLMVDGGDPQLDRAIEETMKLLESSPPVRAKKPAYPRRVPG